MVCFAFACEGYHRRQAARLPFVLGDPERVRVWPVAIKALEELFCPKA